MASIIERLKARPEDLFAGRGTTPTRITEAEEVLGVQFSEDYKKILLEFGVIAFDGHELTGITGAVKKVPRKSSQAGDSEAALW